MKFLKFTLVALIAGITTGSSAQTEVLQPHIEKAWLKMKPLKQKHLTSMLLHGITKSKGDVWPYGRL